MQDLFQLTCCCIPFALCSAGSPHQAMPPGAGGDHCCHSEPHLQQLHGGGCLWPHPYMSWACGACSCRLRHPRLQLWLNCAASPLQPFILLVWLKLLHAPRCAAGSEVSAGVHAFHTDVLPGVWSRRWCHVRVHAVCTYCQVGVRVEAEDMRSGQRWHCCSAYLTFVALNSKSKVSHSVQRECPVA